MAFQLTVEIKWSEKMTEPLIHSHITDGLPDNHAMAFENVSCEDCSVLVHSSNNECMTTWVEAGDGDFCLSCFAAKHNTGGVLNWHGTREQFLKSMHLTP